MGVKETSVAIERIPTGIQGLDEIIEGGLIRGDVHLLCGGPGTGKTLFASNFVYNAVQSGERAIYATFEESAEYFKRNTKLLGIDFSELEDEKKVNIIDIDALKGKGLETNMNLLVQACEETKATILVIDSLTALLLACEDQFEMRSFVKSIYNSAKQKKITMLMTANAIDERAGSIEGFLSDSVMLLENYLDKDQLRTRFVILKMRGTNHSRRYHSVIFGPRMIISKY